MIYNIVNNNKLKYIEFENLKELSFIKHGFSTRIGGVSIGSNTSLNLGFKTGDSKENVEENIRKFARTIDVNYENLVLSDQTHGSNIKVVSEEDKGKGIIKDKDYKEIDGLVTNIPGIPLMTIFADCVPIFFVDNIKKVIGLAHAGWKGTRLKIAEKTVKTMEEQYGCNAENIMAVIGPSIGVCCYEIDNNVVEEFKNNLIRTSEFITAKDKNKYNLDLWKANQIILEESGLLKKNIIISGLCTSCNTDIFYSYRKEKGITGRMAAIIELI